MYKLLYKFTTLYLQLTINMCCCLLILLVLLILTIDNNGNVVCA